MSAVNVRTEPESAQERREARESRAPFVSTAGGCSENTNRGGKPHEEFIWAPS